MQIPPKTEVKAKVTGDDPHGYQKQNVIDSYIIYVYRL